MYECYWLYPLVLFAPMCESLLRTVSTWTYCFALLVFSLVWESVADCIYMGLLFCSFGFLPCVRVRCRLYPHGLTVVCFWFSPLCESPLWTVSTWAYCCMLLVFSLVWESVADCIQMGLLFCSFGFLPCVRVRYELYPHGLTVVLFWFSPLCESPLWTVSTWAYCFALLVFSLVWESVADCIHMGLLFYSFGFLACVRVRCGLYPLGLLFYSLGFLPFVRVHCRLYPHGLTVLLFWFSPLCESLLRTVSTWAYCFTLLVFSLMWESVAGCIHMGLLLYSFGFLPCVRVRYELYPHGLTVLFFWFSPLCESPLRTVSTWAYCFTLLVFSLVWESVADCIHLAYCFTL